MGHASLVFVESPDGRVACVLDREHRQAFWKLPGGRSEPGELPEETAVRELEEETGVRLDASRLELIVSEDRGTHMLYVYRAKSSLRGLKKIGEEREEVWPFPKSSISSISFFPPHLELLLAKGLL